jgi:hypothetical protein
MRGEAERERAGRVGGREPRLRRQAVRIREVEPGAVLLHVVPDVHDEEDRAGA